jgi:two-component system cell cycle sensor histidine kinase/response regulator CckA
MTRVSEARTLHGPVLVVEDEDVVRNVARRMLEALGHATAGAGTGAEALESVAAAAPAAVLLDLTLPDMNGGDILGRLRTACPDAHVVLTSGYQKDEVTRGIEVGDAAFLAKPYSLADLEQHFGCAS